MTQLSMFFRCEWTHNITRKIAEWLNIDYRPYSIRGLYQWLKKYKGVKEQKLVFAAAYGAVMYYTWICRCRTFHGEEVWGADQIVHRIKEEIGVQIDTYIDRKKHCNRVVLKSYRQ